MTTQTKLIIGWRVITLSWLTIALMMLFGGYLMAGWTIALSLFFGILSMWIAERRKADYKWGFIYGLTWGMFAVLYYFVLPIPKEKNQL